MAKADQTPETTTKEITVQGVVVSVSQPYAAGHVVTEAEAKALNQVRAENIGNNTRKRIKEILDTNGGDAEAVKAEAQALVAAADEKYEFTLASVGGGGGARLDPLTKECRRVARDAINAKLREAGITQKAYLDQNGEDAIKIKVAELEEHPEIVKVAKANLANRAPAPEISL